MAKYQIGGGFKQDAAESGVWTDDFGPELKIASSESMTYKKALERLFRPHRRKEISVEKSNAITLKAMAEALLVDWKKGDIADPETGKDLTYSVDNAYLALSKDPELRDFVSSYASRVANYKEEALEERVEK
ncbi:hypothetical protein MHM84_03735 [Halomonas sp. McH1-25]|uniref:hypothetical protein n=1 Tax=unclassified Halomonas TaxID=2609666 RepID=UPI001EF6B49D|nr:MULTISPECIES: hypothetical protein [unclassified Halomonas]MCG7598884.1 hypothetical protein [Halomonas sp. McH1-25]MCP1340847.1 hypothetical protein [Halomonas sp. FL8]MCP1361270.1 hypothetical protein [Halomonas sp. BBD45]MCP1363750.1 hypothetical protein [Halomonas sp. BBD48]